MYIYHSYSRKLERAGALTRYTVYKKPVYMRKDPDRESRPMNPDTPRSEFAVARTRYTIYHLIRCNQERINIFVTLTYKENELNIKTAKQDFKLFIKRLNYETSSQSRYICIPERQKRGAVHFHCIFFGLPYQFRVNMAIQFEVRPILELLPIAAPDDGHALFFGGGFDRWAKLVI